MVTGQFHDVQWSLMHRSRAFDPERILIANFTVGYQRLKDGLVGDACCKLVSLCSRIIMKSGRKSGTSRLVFSL